MTEKASQVGFRFVVALACWMSPHIGAQEAAPTEKVDEAATRQYAAAVALQKRELYDLAAEEWLTFIKDFRTDPRIDRGYHYLGICYVKDEQFDKAVATLNKVLKDYPQFALLESTYLYLGVAQYNLGRAGKPAAYDQAAQTFATLLDKYPRGKTVGQALFYLGESLYSRGKKEAAAEKYAQVVQAGLQHELAADALYALGVCQQELGRQEQAGVSYTTFLKHFPKHRLATEVVMRQGETLLAMKRFADAEKLFATAAATPNFVHADFALLQQGSSLSARGQHEKAAALYRTLIQKFPQSKYLPTAYLESGKCAYLAGDYPAARLVLANILEAGGADSAEAAHWIVRSCLKEQQPAVALPIIEKALAAAAKTKTPFAVQLALDHADVLYEIPERRQEAETLYEFIAAKYSQDPLAPQAAYMSAFAALGRQDYRQVLKQADVFLKTYTGHALEPDVIYLAAESHVQLNEHAQAEKLYRRLTEKYPSHADANQWKVRSAFSLFLQKKYPETIAAVDVVLPNLQSPALVAEARYLAGSAQLELKQFDAAVQSLNASVQADSSWRQADEALLALAHANRQTDNLNAARTVLQKLIGSFPKSELLDRAQYRLAEYAYAAQDYPAAISQYQKVIAKWPKSTFVPYALFGIGWSQLSQSNYEAAAKTLTELAERFPQHEVTPRGRYARALARQRLKEYAAATEDLNAFFQSNPSASDLADARYVLGLCQAALDKRAEAVATFQSILEQFPQYTGADKTIYELAWTLKDLGKDAEAAEWFVRLSSEHDASPLAAESLFQAGELAYQQQDYAKAAGLYADAEKKAGKSELGEKTIYKLGWSFFRQDRFDEATRVFNAQRAKYPQGPLSADAIFMQGECLFKQAKFAESLPVYAEVKNPTGKEFGALALLHAGQAAAQLKDWQQSLKLLDQLIRDYPQSEYQGEALYEQGWAQQNLGRLDKALVLYRMVPDKTSREVAARAWFMSGKIYFDKKDHKEAIRCFLKTAIGYSYPQWQANAHYEAGRCFEAIDKKEQAIQSYQEVTSKHPQSDQARLAQQRLDVLTKQ